MLTLRGALVRDPRLGALPHRDDRPVRATTRRGVRVAPLAHLGPRASSSSWRMQRDMYAYLHDQTLRMINQGFVGAEIAEASRCRRPRGRVAHPRLLRLGQPQREGHLPALHGLVRRQPGPPVAAPAGGAAARYVAGHGRRRRALAKARESFERGDSAGPRLVNHVIFADPEHAEARDLLADALEQLGFGSRTARGATSSSPAPPSCGPRDPARRPPPGPC